MTCLNPSQIQTVADGEAAADLRQHAASCPTCSARVRERHALTGAVVDVVQGDAKIPARLVHRMETMLAAAETSGATRLRADPSRQGRRHRAFWSAAVAVAATVIGVLFIGPIIREPAAVSAAGILAASANRLAQPVTSGIETLEYELVVDGVPLDLIPDQTNGTYRVRQVIDHDNRGHFRYTSYTPDGQLLSSIGQDPALGRRVVAVRLKDQAYRFEFTLPAQTPLSLPEMEKLHMQASISMMQASGAQQLQEIDTPDGKAYRIEVPRVAASATNAVWDMTEAQIVVDADDYRIIQLAVKGAFLRQPYSISFRLLTRSVTSAVPPEEFEVPVDAGAINFYGEGSAIPVRDALLAALEELARMKKAR
jgi:hypothetical protein